MMSKMNIPLNLEDLVFDVAKGIHKVGILVHMGHHRDSIDFLERLGVLRRTNAAQVELTLPAKQWVSERLKEGMRL
jgi:hypothetical protein